MLKNKRIFFILLVLVLFLLSSTSSFATTGNEETDKLIKNNFYYIGLYVHSNYGDFSDYVVINNGESSDLVVLNPSNGFFTRATGGYAHTDYSLIFLDITSTKFDKETDISKYLYLNRWNGSSDNPDFFNPNVFNEIVYTTCKEDYISCTDNFGDLDYFFYKTRLARVVKQAGTRQTLNQVVQLLPTILVVVVFFLGLRKALRILSKVLHQS